MMDHLLDAILHLTQFVLDLYFIDTWEARREIEAKLGAIWLLPTANQQQLREVHTYCETLESFDIANESCSVTLLL